MRADFGRNGTDQGCLTFRTHGRGLRKIIKCAENREKSRKRRENCAKIAKIESELGERAAFFAFSLIAGEGGFPHLRRLNSTVQIGAWDVSFDRLGGGYFPKMHVLKVKASTPQSAIAVKCFKRV